jgi:hypothetical protein
MLIANTNNDQMKFQTNIMNGYDIAIFLFLEAIKLIIKSDCINKNTVACLH